MKQIPVGESLFAIVDDEDFEMLSRYNWRLDHGYPFASVNGQNKRMHQLLVKCSPGMMPDHRNRNKLDNRKENFRQATPLQNSVNQALRKDNTSGFKGVTWNKSVGKWKAQIRGAGKRLFLGYFRDATDAARAYDAKARELFGEFAFLNFGD